MRRPLILYYHFCPSTLNPEKRRIDYLLRVLGGDSCSVSCTRRTPPITLHQHSVRTIGQGNRLHQEANLPAKMIEMRLNPSSLSSERHRVKNWTPVMWLSPSGATEDSRLSMHAMRSNPQGMYTTLHRRKMVPSPAGQFQSQEPSAPDISHVLSPSLAIAHLLLFRHTAQLQDVDRHLTLDISTSSKLVFYH